MSAGACTVGSFVCLSVDGGKGHSLEKTCGVSWREGERMRNESGETQKTILAEATVTQYLATKKAPSHGQYQPQPQALKEHRNHHPVPETRPGGLLDGRTI